MLGSSCSRHVAAGRCEQCHIRLGRQVVGSRQQQAAAGAYVSPRKGCPPAALSAAKVPHVSRAAGRAPDANAASVLVGASLETRRWPAYTTAAECRPMRRHAPPRYEEERTNAVFADAQSARWLLHIRSSSHKRTLVQAVEVRPCLMPRAAARRRVTYARPPFRPSIPPPPPALHSLPG